jgi:hypothetical protein
MTLHSVCYKEIAVVVGETNEPGSWPAVGRVPLDSGGQIRSAAVLNAG